MTDLPTLRPQDVSPLSPYVLAASSQYVIGAERPDGFLIYSQHRTERAANDRRYREWRYSQNIHVRRVERGDENV